VRTRTCVYVRACVFNFDVCLILKSMHA